MEEVSGNQVDGNVGEHWCEVHEDGSVTLTNGKVTLRFTMDEWRAFVLGVKNGEFDLRQDK